MIQDSFIFVIYIFIFKIVIITQLLCRYLIITIIMRILITGISGQDGIFLTDLLRNLYKELNIIGISRNFKTEQFKKYFQLQEFKNNQSIQLIDLNLLDAEKVNDFVLDFDPNFIFNLSGPSSVYESITNPKLKDDIENIFINLTNPLIKNKNFIFSSINF